MHAYEGPATLRWFANSTFDIAEAVDGSAFDVELAPSRPTVADVLPSDAGPHGYCGWVEVAAFTDAPTTVDVTFTCGTGSSPAPRRATETMKP